jgi:stage V sporulation protein G
VEITEVRIKLMDEPGERLQAFCSITFDDCFVVRDLKIIEGSSGPFVAMPSRKLTCHCPQCGCKNHLRAAYCNQCGSRLREHTMAKDDEGRAKLYADIAHPINSACREIIQTRVIRAYEEEKTRSRLPGYVPQSYDVFDAGEEGPAAPPTPAAPAAATGEPVAETAQIQPPEKPRGPHRAPAHAPQDATRPKSNSFGEGIF